MILKTAAFVRIRGGGLTGFVKLISLIKESPTSVSLNAGSNLQPTLHSPSPTSCPDPALCVPPVNVLGHPRLPESNA